MWICTKAAWSLLETDRSKKIDNLRNAWLFVRTEGQKSLLKDILTHDPFLPLERDGTFTVLTCDKVGKPCKAKTTSATISESRAKGLLKRQAPLERKRCKSLLEKRLTQDFQKEREKLRLSRLLMKWVFYLCMNAVRKSNLAENWWEKTNKSKQVELLHGGVSEGERTRKLQK